MFIEIEDDGAGINRDKVLAKAISRGVVTQEQALSMTDKQINELILASGFSTADVISDISGRGVGLDVVAIAGEMMRMPGLPKVPAANNIDIVDGEITGLS